MDRLASILVTCSRLCGPDFEASHTEVWLTRKSPAHSMTYNSSGTLVVSSYLQLSLSGPALAQGLLGLPLLL